MRACILSVGDELVLGQTVDTNSAWLSQQLAAVGCEPAMHATVADDQAAIERAIVRAARDDGVELLVISGGIGPTEDDLTRQALAAVLGQPLEANAEWLAELDRFFAKVGRAMPAANKIQAMIPQGAMMIFNTCGTAAGIAAVLDVDVMQGIDVLPTDPRRPRPMCRVFVMPGVPREMKAMFARDVLPYVRDRAGGACILSRTLHTFGLGESAVAERLSGLMRRDRNPSVGTTVSQGIVSLRLNVRAASGDAACAQLDETERACRAALGDLIFGHGDETLAHVVVRLLDQSTLAQRWAPAVATVESCTGGLLAKMLTDVPGASRHVRQGWVTYSNEAKTNLVNVAGDLIAAHGAVSEPVVRAMVDGGRAQSGAYYTLAVTGIAGPGGGTADKPIGTVWIALAAGERTIARRFLFNYGDREFIRDRAAKMALSLLRYELLGTPMPF